MIAEILFCTASFLPAGEAQGPQQQKLPENESAPADPQPRGEGTNPLAPIGRAMGLARSRLDQKDLGEDTIAIQTRIAKDLETLIQALAKQQSQSQQSSSRSTSQQPRQQPDDSAGQNKPQQGETAASGGTDPTGQVNDPAAAAMSAQSLIRTIWGHLPDRLKDEMQQTFAETMLPRYRLRIEGYFRRITEQSLKQN